MPDEGNVSLDSFDGLKVELPPHLARFRDVFRQDRKRLLKDKTFNDPSQLRQFVGQFLMPRMEELFVLLSAAFVDTYGLAASGMNEIHRLRRELDVEEGGGLDIDDFDGLQKAMFALGSLIQKREDKELGEAYNACAQELSGLIGKLIESEDEPPPDEKEEQPQEEARDE